MDTVEYQLHIKIEETGSMRRERQPAVYILSNRKHGTLYIGVSSDLPKRIAEHKSHALEGFSRRYGLDKLVYYELHSDMRSAIEREKQLKKWKREWKIQLIQENNPQWEDLYGSLFC